MSQSVKNNRQDWIAGVLRAGLYLVAFVPLIIFSEYISPFHFGKVVIFRSIIEIMAVFYLILIWKNRSYLPNRHIIFTVIGLFTLVFCFSTLASVNSYLSFWGSLERMGGLWSFFHYLVYLVILVSIFKKRDDWIYLASLAICVGVISAFYGFGQKTNIDFFIGSGNRERIFGTLGNPALFAGYQIVILFLALTLALSSWVKSTHKNLLLCAALISLVAVLMTAVRGSILGIGLGLVLFCFLYVLTLGSKVAKKILFVLIGIGVLFFIFALTFKNSSFVKNSGYLTRLTDFSLQTRTVQTRFWAWQAGLTGWKETPKTVLFGWGPENFNVPFSKHFNPKFFRGFGSETLFDRAHNMFVEILVTTGLFAAALYIALFIVSIRILWVKLVRGSDKVVGIGLISLIVAYVVHNSFIFDTSANLIMFFTILGFVIWLTQNKVDNISDNVTKRLSLFQQSVMILLLMGSFYLIYKTNILPAKANHTTTRAITFSWAGDFDKALTKFKEALDYDVPGKYEYRHRYAQWVLEQNSGKKLGEKEIGILEHAIEQVQKNADENDQDYLPYLYLSRIHIVLGKDNKSSPHNDEALRNSLKALEISPTFIRTYYEVAQAYINKGDSVNAIKYFKEAVDLNPEVGLTYWYLGATYLESGDTKMGLEAIDKAINLGYFFTEADNKKLINLYAKTGDFEKVVSLYEQLVSSKPDNAQYKASLAAAYARVGRIDEAVEQARAAAKLDKSFEKEAGDFVKSLGREL